MKHPLGIPVLLKKGSPVLLKKGDPVSLKKGNPVLSKKKCLVRAPNASGQTTYVKSIICNYRYTVAADGLQCMACGAGTYKVNPKP